MERLLDAAAEALGLDRAEIRRRNLVPQSRMPHATGIMTRGGMPTMSPHPQPLPRRGQQRRPQRPPMPMPPMRGMNDEFRGRRLHRIRVLQLRVPHQLVAQGQQQMRDPVPLTPANPQPPLLGHRRLPVGRGGLADQREHGPALVRGERGVGLDGTGAGRGPYGVVAGHGYEGKPIPPQSGGKEETRM